MGKAAGKKVVLDTLKIIILLLAAGGLGVNSYHYEFPRILLPFIFEIESIAIVFTYLIYVITIILKTPEDNFLLLTIVSFFHGVICLAVSISMLITFTGETILGFESDVWDKVDKLLLILSGAFGAATSLALFIQSIICLCGLGKGEDQVTDA